MTRRYLKLRQVSFLCDLCYGSPNINIWIDGGCSTSVFSWLPPELTCSPYYRLSPCQRNSSASMKNGHAGNWMWCAEYKGSCAAKTPPFPLVCVRSLMKEDTVFKWACVSVPWPRCVRSRVPLNERVNVGRSTLLKRNFISLLLTPLKIIYSVMS
jgi:hypothetical protein